MTVDVVIALLQCKSSLNWFFTAVMECHEAYVSRQKFKTLFSFTDPPPYAKGTNINFS